MLQKLSTDESILPIVGILIPISDDLDVWHPVWGSVHKSHGVVVAGANKRPYLIEILEMVLREVLQLDLAASPSAGAVGSVELEHALLEGGLLYAKEEGDARHLRQNSVI